MPFGYRVENRKLVIDKAAAVEVKMQFRRYLELGSVPALARELNNRDWGSSTPPIRTVSSDVGQGCRRPVKTVGKGRLYYMLSNPI